MELLKIEHNSITVALDPLDCLRLAQACRAADHVLAGDMPGVPLFGLSEGSSGSSAARPLGQRYTTLAALFAAGAVAGNDAYDLPIGRSVEPRWPHGVEGLIGPRRAPARDGQAEGV